MTSTVMPETISRYLSDKLSESERKDFESHCARDPEVVQDLEATLRFREGLAILRDRGELAPLMPPVSRFRPAVLWGLAAAVACLALATALWVRPLQPPARVLTAAIPANATVGRTYSLVTTRGPADVLAITSPTDGRPVEFRLLPEYRSSAGRYHVTLAGSGVDGRSVVLGSLDHLEAGADGFITVYAQSAGLHPGRYVLAVAPEPDGDAMLTARFAIELRPGRAGNAAP